MGVRLWFPVASLPHYPFEGDLGRGAVPQRPPQIASPCMLFSAAGREEGRGPPGVEGGRRKGQVLTADGVGEHLPVGAHP